MQRKKPRKLKKRKNKIRVVDAAHSPLFHTAVPVRNRGLCVYSGESEQKFLITKIQEWYACSDFSKLSFAY